MSNFFYFLKNNKAPLVHCITNYVTVNDCANAILAFGGSPIMAQDIEEVSEVVNNCQGLVLNIGTLHKNSATTMVKAGKQANQRRVPVILDPVGVGVSKLRRETVEQLINQVQFSVIKGNSTEIKTLVNLAAKSNGVDACETDKITKENLHEGVLIAKKLSKQTGAIVVLTGEIDIITNGETTYCVHNGHPYMGKITGTGCMLSGLLGVSTAGKCENILINVVQTVSFIGVCGELAYQQIKKENAGTGSFKVMFMDYLSTLTKEQFEEKSRIEEFK